MRSKALYYKQFQGKNKKTGGQKNEATSNTMGVYHLKTGEDRKRQNGNTIRQTSGNRNSKSTKRNANRLKGGLRPFLFFH